MAHDILIVDDEEDIRLLIVGILNDEGYQARGAADADAALAEINGRLPAMVVLDIWLQGSRLDGLELLKVLRQRHPSLPVVMISGHGNIATAVGAIKLGAYDYIEKPFKADRLLLVIERALEAARLRRENEELRLRAESDVPLVGQSAPISSVRAAIERVAPTNSRVLITGGPGSGKEIVARHVHRLSKRAEGPFVVLNAASITPERMEQELFGSEPVPGS
ncbi:MAG: sigma-54-dependent Fis family transcriptional regulator, partial [Alphaproteobacteria bacterium]|nr:sigma-54-dependent Fis family transcriptional regulator [Alphaproteobacteria bacterium]